MTLESLSNRYEIRFRTYFDMGVFASLAVNLLWLDLETLTPSNKRLAIFDLKHGPFIFALKK